MEKKKLLLVAISTGIFLVFTIMAAILVFTPKNAASVATMSYPANTGTVVVPPPSYQGSVSETQGSSQSAQDAVDLIRNNTDTPGLRTPPETSRQGDDFHVSGTSSVINVPKPGTVTVPNTTPAGRTAPVQATQTTQQRPTAASQPSPVAQTRVYNDYWVQTGAFSTVAKAEGVKEILASKGIASIIENREIDGRTLFRVRVGPYTSNNEAIYWLSLIKSISGFEDSQIRLTQTRR
jgi:DedD protein